VTDIGGERRVVKLYRREDVERYMCVGSGARNEGLLPAPLAGHVPALVGYGANADCEVAILELVAGEQPPAALWADQRTRAAGRMLGLIHSQVGDWFGSLDGAYRFDGLSAAFRRRWSVAMDLLRQLDAGLATAAEDWAAARLARLRARSGPRLVHGDYGSGNLIWRGPTSAVVLDWEHARYGDPGEDWAKILLAALFPERNGFGRQPATLVDLYAGWREATGHDLYRIAADLDLYLAYFAATLGAFLSSDGGARLDFLRALVTGRASARGLVDGLWSVGAAGVGAE
jgi:aminoglycoside phosphotransferase (APT) family kinase protein